MQLRFQPDAEADLAKARVWYALQREGLDDALTRRVDEALERIVRAVLRQFPFAIFYEPTENEILVFAVYHSSRDPKKLRSRLLDRR